jgi:hypothetical protein
MEQRIVDPPVEETRELLARAGIVLPKADLDAVAAARVNLINLGELLRAYLRDEDEPPDDRLQR